MFARVLAREWLVHGKLMHTTQRCRSCTSPNESSPPRAPTGHYPPGAYVQDEVTYSRSSRRGPEPPAGPPPRPSRRPRPVIFFYASWLAAARRPLVDGDRQCCVLRVRGRRRYFVRSGCRACPRRRPLPATHPLERFRWFWALDRHHYLHHVDTRANVNFLLPLGDGCLQRCARG